MTIATPGTPAGHIADARIGFVHIDTLFWNYFQYHLAIQAKQLGAEFLDRPVLMVRDHCSAMGRLLDENVNVLLFLTMSTDDAGFLATIEQAHARGVHLIAIDGRPGGSIDVCSVGADSEAGQAAVAEYAFQKLRGKGKVAYLQGDMNTDAGLLRNQGFQSVLPRYPGIDVVFTAPFDWTSSAFSSRQGLELARRALDAHPDLEAIITTSDEGAIGVIEALNEKGLRGKIMVTGFDAVPAGLVALKDGDLEATARQPLEAMAYRVFELISGMLKGESKPTSRSLLPVELITREKLGETALRALRIFPQVTEDLNQRTIEQQNAANFLEVLLDNMPTMLFVKEAQQMRYIRVNKAREAWLDSPHGSQLGKNVFDYYPREIAEKYDAEDRAVLASGAPLDIPEEESFRVGFGLRFTHNRKIPIFNATGEPAYLLCIAEDITARKRAEQSLAQHTADLEHTNKALKLNFEQLVIAEKLAALGALVAGVAHELNTPIGNALVAVTAHMDNTRLVAEKYAKGLSRSVLESYLADAIEGADILERNLRRSAELIRSFKQISLDQTSSQRRHFSLATVVAETLLSLSPTLKKLPYLVEQNIPADLNMNSFPGPLEQVLMNLINNAVIHGLTGRDEGVITISATPAQPGWVELFVQDNGAGIAQANLKRIFDPFFSTRFGSGGSGLGLSISHSIVTGLLGGQIDVSSTPGVGTQFRLSLPCEPGTARDD